jgi:hypothetical protein
MYLKRTQKSFVVHEYGTGAVQGFCLLFLIPLLLDHDAAVLSIKSYETRLRGSGACA